MNAKAQKSAYQGLGGMLAAGFGDELQSDEADIIVNLDDIEIQAQDRGVDAMEDDEQSLADLGKSLRKRQAQAIVIRANVAGAAKPYLLVAGERRVRAAKIEGLPTLRARLMTLTDEEAQELQTAENIHRKNLTQIEEARRVQRDLNALNGDVDALLAKYHKSRPWLSKLLSLLDLPDQAKRLVSENVSADIEVINTVKTIERIDPEKAKTLVDDLKASRGKVNARDKVQAVKEEVKPKKVKRGQDEEGGSVATPKDRSQEEPSEGKTFAGAKTKKADKPLTAPEALARAYSNIFEFGSTPKVIHDCLSDEDRAAASEFLMVHFNAGKNAKGVGRGVMSGLRNGTFATDGAGALALVAFLAGAEGGVKFDLLDILGAVKP